MKPVIEGSVAVPEAPLRELTSGVEIEEPVHVRLDPCPLDFQRLDEALLLLDRLVGLLEVGLDRLV